MDSFVVGGAQLAPETYQTVAPGTLGKVTLTAGNTIYASAYILAQQTVGASGAVTMDLSNINVVAARFQTDWRATPTAPDIVKTSMDFAGAYSGVPNTFDCVFIAQSLAGATGAPLPALWGAPVPSSNTDGGLWRVAYRGDTGGLGANWYSVLQPGDVVRVMWSKGGGHGFTVVGSLNADGSIPVFDNVDYRNGIEVIGEHNASYYQTANPASVTVYRLSSDHLYLIPVPGPNETITGVPGMSNNMLQLSSGHTDISSDRLVNIQVLDMAGQTGTMTSAQYHGFNSILNQARITLTDTGQVITPPPTAGSGHGVLVTAADGTQVATGADGAMIARLYQAALGRQPDAAGLQTWTNGYEAVIPAAHQAAAKGSDWTSYVQALANDPINGKSMAYSFTHSQEFLQNYGALTDNTAFVTQLYRNVLHREPESTGLAGWVNAANAGMSHETILVGFAMSQENVAKTAAWIAGA